MPRASKLQKQHRIEKAAEMLAQGHSGTSVVTHMTRSEGVSRRTAQRMVSDAYQVLIGDMESFDLNRKELVSQLINNLQEGIRRGLIHNQISAVVSAVRALDDLCGLGEAHNRRPRRTYYP